MAATKIFACDPIPDLQWFDRASERVVLESELACSPERLFEIFRDPVAWSVWVTSIVRVDWTSPPPYRAGTTRTVLAKGNLLVHEEFLAWDEGRLMAFAFVGASKNVWRQMGERYEVEERADGRCRLRWTIAYEPRGLFAALHPMIRPWMRRSLAGMLANLRAYVAKERSTAALTDDGRAR